MPMTSNLTRCLFFSRKTVNINVSLSVAPKIDLVPASRYYCDVNWSYHNVCTGFIRIDRGSDGST